MQTARHACCVRPAVCQQMIFLVAAQLGRHAGEVAKDACLMWRLRFGTAYIQVLRQLLAAPQTDRSFNTIADSKQQVT